MKAKKEDGSRMQSKDRIFIAGHAGLAGSAILREFERRGYSELLTRSHKELDLENGAQVRRFFEEEQPQYVVLAAAKVGGILANTTYPADFIRDNLEIQNNVIEASRNAGVNRLLFLGSSCIYPRLCPQPIREEYLLTGPLEPTNRPYALAKIAGIEMCWAYNRQYGTKYLSAMPSNLYGPNDNFDLTNSHVLPALLRKISDARRKGDPYVTIWGTGTPRRELLYSEDMAKACIFLMELDDARYDSLIQEDTPPLINIGTGEDVSVRELAEKVASLLEFDGEFRFDTSKPDGTPRKLLDVSKIQALGWRATTSLDEGIRLTYEAARPQFAGEPSYS
jgi:GDP-L-fucose synthase